MVQGVCGIVGHIVGTCGSGSTVLAIALGLNPLSEENKEEREKIETLLKNFSFCIAQK